MFKYIKFSNHAENKIITSNGLISKWEVIGWIRFGINLRNYTNNNEFNIIQIKRKFQSGRFIKIIVCVKELETHFIIEKIHTETCKD